MTGQLFRHTIYRLQNAIFALRRLLPGRLRQALKPLYRRWWRKVSQKSLTRPAAAPGETPPAGYAVLCFSPLDWELRIQRPQQLLLRLARAGHRIYYLRTDFAPGRSSAPLEPLAPHVFGLRLPGPAGLNIYHDSPSPAQIETWLEALDELRQSEGLVQVISLVQLPFWGPPALAARQRWNWPVVYDCLDDHHGFSTNRAAMLALEPALIAESDLVLATARQLYARCAPLARRCTLLPNAADDDHFRQPVGRAVLSDLHGPIVGYYGSLADWIEVEWIQAAAQAHPEWQFVLIGLNSGLDLRHVEKLPNVHLLGERPYESLPDYLHRFDVATIPFKLNAVTQATNPVKFYEYLSAGKPVVATALPELEPYRALFYPASTAADFVQQLEAALAEHDPSLVQARRAAAQANTWDARVAVLDAQVRQLLEQDEAP